MQKPNEANLEQTRTPIKGDDVKRRVLKLAVAIGGALSLTACVTSFQGSPHVEGGRQGCEAKCRGQGMAVAGMVYMGEYSSACVCQVPEGAAGHASLTGGAAAAAGGAVAVEMMRRQQQQNQMNQGGVGGRY
jgi:hypothetical protein